MVNNKKEKPNEIIETGSDLAGAAVGGALGFLTAGPIGSAGASVAGVMIAKSVKKLLSDFVDRQMSHRETERVGATAAIAINDIKTKIDMGETPRDDDFFQEINGRRSSAEEIFEGTLQKSKTEHEDKKIKLIGHYFANVAFSKAISVGEANHLLNIIGRLSYRQLCVLGILLIKQNSKSPQTLREEDYANNTIGLKYETLSLLQEIYNLYNDGLIVCKNSNSPKNIALLSWHDIIPNNLMLNFLGIRLAKLLDVETIDSDDLNKIIILLGKGIVNV